MQTRSRRFLPVLTLALLGLLICAASAAAEVRTGEVSSAVDIAIPGGIDIVKASASYDSGSGAGSLQIVTRESPTKPDNGSLFIGLVSVSGPCDVSVGTSGQTIVPAAIFQTSYTPPSDPNEPAAGYSFFQTQPKPGEPGQPTSTGPAAKTIGPTSIVLEASVPANQPFNCVVAETRAENGQGEQDDDLVAFPIAVAPETPQPVTPAPAPVIEVQTVTKTVAPPPSAPAALSLARPKPVNANARKWTTVKVVVTNSGGTAAGPVSLKFKAPKGVLVKPASVGLPALLPGQSWTVPVRVKATEQAKKASAVTLTASLPGATTSSSFTVKSTD